MEIEQINNLSITEVKELVKKYEKYFEENIESKELNVLLLSLSQDKRKGVQSIYNKILKIKDNFLKELKRVEKLYNFDRTFNEFRYIAGVDEVGRGPLAGPIVAAAVILDLNKIIPYINDSKKIKEDKREELSEIIKEQALDYNIVKISNEEIDKKGIGICNNQVFIRAIEGLKIKPDLILSDGYLIRNWKGPLNKHVIKGDATSATIACASIIAKVYRDNLMKSYSDKYPEYAFEKNVGYGTKEHIEAIENYGICEIHRKSFLHNLGY